MFFTHTTWTLPVMSTQYLTAAYKSSIGEENFSSSLPTLPANNVQDKTAYLSALRSNITQLQGDINKLLTQKMEEEKAAGGKKAVADEKAEEMYGEEEDDAEG